MSCLQKRNNILLETKRWKCNPIRNSSVDCSDEAFSLDSNILIERSVLAVLAMENRNDFADNSVNNLECSSVKSGALNLNLHYHVKKTGIVTKIENIKTDETKILRPTDFSG